MTFNPQTVDVNELTGKELVAAYNALIEGTEATPVKRFANVDAGRRRVAALQAAKAPVEKAPVEKAPVEKAPVEKAPVEKAPGGRMKTKVREPKEGTTYAPRPGTLQETALTLLRQEGGVDVDEFIAAMNAICLPKGGQPWTYGNTWSGLVTILHASKGYGLSYDADTRRLAAWPGSDERAHKAAKEGMVTRTD